MKNEASWLELFDLPVFNDADDSRHDQVWKWVQELQAGGRLTASDVFALQCMVEALSQPATDATHPPAAALREDQVERVATAMAGVIAKRHGHSVDTWLNDERREEAKAAIAALSEAPNADGSEPKEG